MNIAQIILWCALLILMLIVEAATLNLVSIWFAGGALCALISALCGASVWLQICLFVVVSGVLLAVLYPLARRSLRKRPRAKTNADRILDMTAVVTEPIDNLAETGAIRVDGKIWSARSDDGSPIAAEELVHVLRIEGVKAIVSRVPAPQTTAKERN